MTVSIETLEALRESNAIEGIYDLASYCQALLAFDYMLKQDEITLDVILKAHKTLMKGQPLETAYKGNWRTIQVFIGGREAPRWEGLPLRMEDWIENDWLRMAPLDSHVTFEQIHPFVDGNGRIGRMLLFWKQIKDHGVLQEYPTKAKVNEYYGLFR